jgi:cobalt/nickel transport system permease protein
MHLPDGFLSPIVSCAAAGVSASSLAVAALRRTELRAPALRRTELRDPALSTAALGAFVFGAQAFQFPIPGGSSGHLLGAALLAACVGPARGLIAIASVLAVQAFAFGDGGVLALGANVLNVGVPGVIAGALYRRFPSRRVLGAGAFAATIVGAAAVAVELALSGTAPLGAALGAMLVPHLWIGLAEGLLTALIAPPLRRRVESGEPVAAPALGIAALLLVAAPWLACSRPDGLQHAAQELGISSLERF